MILNELIQVRTLKGLGGVWDNMHDQSGRVYSPDGLCPTIHTFRGGGQEIKICVENSKILRPERTEYGKKIRKKYESKEVWDSRHNMTTLQPREDGITNTLTTVQKDNLLLEPVVAASRGRKIDDENNNLNNGKTEQKLEVNKSGSSNTLTTVQKDNYVIEPQLVGGIGEKNFGKQYRQGNRVYDSESVSMALLSQPVGNTGGYSYLYKVDVSENSNKTVNDDVNNSKGKSRIRKLTPRECFRLMGFTDEDFFSAMIGCRNKAREIMKRCEDYDDIDLMVEMEKEQVVSNSQLYKQAGNSIVVETLCSFLSVLFKKPAKVDYNSERESGSSNCWEHKQNQL